MKIGGQLAQAMASFLDEEVVCVRVCVCACVRVPACVHMNTNTLALSLSHKHTHANTNSKQVVQRTMAEQEVQEKCRMAVVRAGIIPFLYNTVPLSFAFNSVPLKIVYGVWNRSVFFMEKCTVHGEVGLR